jgi:hypothetical protein
MAAALDRYDELMPEAEVCRRYAPLVSEKELRGARQRGEIPFYSGKRGMVLYHPDAIASYLQRKESPCRRECGSKAATGSGPRTTPQSSTPTGMTSEQAQLVAARLGQKYSPKRKKRSSSLSENPGSTGANLRVVS